MIDYSTEFVAGYYRSVSFGINLPELETVVQRYLTTENDFRLKNAIKDMGCVNYCDVERKCHSFNIAAKHIFEKHFNCNVYYTIGYVQFADGKKIFHSTEKQLKDMFLNGVNNRELNFHVWLTLPSLEIIDLTFTQTILRQKGNIKIITQHYSEFKSGLSYHPMLIGEEFVYRVISNQKCKIGIIPRSESEFNSVMKDIDSSMKRKGIDIPNRPIRAVGEYADRYDLALTLTSNTDIIDGIYVGGSATARIKKWYDDLYGDRLKVSLTDRHTLIMLLGEVWEFTIPIVYGEVEFVVSADLEIENNILKYINKITKAMVENLTYEDFLFIRDKFLHHMDTINSLTQRQGNSLIKAAIADLQASVQQIVNQPYHYGQAKWHIAQATEKILKAYIEKYDPEFHANHHDL